MNTTVVVIFFNRIEPLRILMARLAEVKPKRLYLVSDGARLGVEGEQERVDACREFMQNIPWECEVVRDYASVNMGCRQRIVSGVNNALRLVETVIVLEDDCIPELRMFPFMEDMLVRYADNEKVLSIGATNYYSKGSMPGYDAFFTKYPVSTGWATWRRAWRLMDTDLLLLPEARRTHKIRKWLGSYRAEWYWFYVMQKKIFAWDYRWAFTGFMYSGVHLLPSRNLIKNIGIDDPLATNTKEYFQIFPEPDSDWVWSGKVPDKVESYSVFDKMMEDNHYSKSLPVRMHWCINKLRNRLSKII